MGKAFSELAEIKTSENSNRLQKGLMNKEQLLRSYSFHKTDDSSTACSAAAYKIRNFNTRQVVY